MESARRELEAVVREIDPTQPFIEIQSLDAMMMNSVGMQRFYLVVLSAFAVFAVLLAAVGIYAAYSYAIASRTAEIGVRLALGATPRGIIIQCGPRRCSAERCYCRGLVAAAGGARILNSVLFEVSATDPLSYAAVGASLLLTVLTATLIPAIGAARIDPLAAIRR